jgi:hypothetical protein
MQTVRLVEIAEILGVSHQRASKIVEMPGFPQPNRPGESEPAVGSARGHGVGEGLAAREALAVTHSVEGAHARMRQCS